MLKFTHTIPFAGPSSKYESQSSNWLFLMIGALLAPTAVNQQKFEFELVDDHTVRASARFTLIGYGKIDLGIVKYHFEVGAGKENFAWQWALAFGRECADVCGLRLGQWNVRPDVVVD